MSSYQKSQSEKINEAVARHFGLIQTADCYAVGENDGGAYVSLFNSRMSYRICTVYSEAFERLPAGIDTTDVAGDISTERKRLEKQGILRQCPPFGFTRYKTGDHEDEKTPWRFGDTLWASGQKPTQAPQRPAPAPAAQQAASNGNGQPAATDPAQGKRWSAHKPPVMESWDDLIEWAVGVQAYRDEKQARENMRSKFKECGNPTIEDFRLEWIGHIRNRIDSQAKVVGVKVDGNSAQPVQAEMMPEPPPGFERESSPFA